MSIHYLTRVRKSSRFSTLSMRGALKTTPHPRRKSRTSFTVFSSDCENSFVYFLCTNGPQRRRKPCAATVSAESIHKIAPLFVPEAADETVDFQINAIVDALEKLKTVPASE